MAVGAIGELESERAAQARAARPQRFVALVIDTVLFGLITLIINSVFGVTQVTSGTFNDFGGFSTYSSVTEAPWPLLTLVWLAYLIVPEAMFGATPGKLALGVRVVRVDGRPLSLGSIVVRNLLKLIDWLPLLYLIGGLSVLVTKNSQRLGDLAAKTTVVQWRNAVEPGATRASSRSARRVLLIVLLLAVAFIVGFDYFGRPPLVVEGLYNTHSLAVRDVSSYTISDPRWGLGTVTYRLQTAGSGGGSACDGTITLVWNWLGWQESSSTLSCAS